MIRRLCVLLVLLIAIPINSQILVTGAEGLTVTLTSQITPVPLNQMHSWVISLHSSSGEPVEGASIQIEGGMPLHDHGLATNPQVTDYLGNGQYLIEGLRFHMPGEWLLTILIEDQGRQYRSEAAFTLGTD